VKTTVRFANKYFVDRKRCLPSKIRTKGPIIDTKVATSSNNVMI
jgi:hypothetical protein